MSDTSEASKKSQLVSERSMSWVYRFVVLAVIGFYITQQMEDFKKIREIDTLSRDYKDIRKTVSDNQADIVERMKAMQVKVDSVSQTVMLTDQMLRSSIIDRMRVIEEQIAANAGRDTEQAKEFAKLREEMIVLREKMRAMESASPSIGTRPR